MKRLGSAMALALMLATLGSVALAQTPAPATTQPAQIDRNGVLILVRTTLNALDQANKTGNYTVLRDLGAPGFRTNTDARLAEIFAPLRRANLDLSGALALEPQLNQVPQIDAQGLMRMTGFFPAATSQVNFDLLFAPVDGQWRPFGISVWLGQVAPVAPQPAAPAPSAAPKPGVFTPPKN
jgi:hypothetical protein